MLAGPPPLAAMAACYLYVLPLLHEDLAKVGISVDPLARVRAFSPRYYESFDLPRSILVGFDSVREARRRETGLHRQLRQWSAVQPLTVPAVAGGHTEWYRGASAILQAEAGQDRELGLDVHLPAGDWWRRRLRQEQPLLYEWCEQALRDVAPDALRASAPWSAVVDVLDAWPALDLDLGEALPVEVGIAYREYRRAWRHALGD